VELERLAREARHRERQAFYEAVLGAVCAAMADARKAHGENLDGLETSVAKRVAGRLWNLLWPKPEDAGGTPLVCERPSDATCRPRTSSRCRYNAQVLRLRRILIRRPVPRSAGPMPCSSLQPSSRS
jgi:hypothetical protein